MKTKTLSKKLMLNKDTIANLETKDLEQVMGGIVILTKFCQTTLATNSCLSTNYCC